MAQRLLRRLKDEDIADAMSYLGIGEDPLGNAGEVSLGTASTMTPDPAAALQTAAAAPIAPFNIAGSVQSPMSNKLLRGNIISPTPVQQNADFPVPAFTPPEPVASSGAPSFGFRAPAITQPAAMIAPGPVASQFGTSSFTSPSNVASRPPFGRGNFNFNLLRGTFNPIAQSSVVPPAAAPAGTSSVNTAMPGDTLDQAASSHNAEVLANRPFDMSGLRSTGDFRQAINDNQTAAMPEKHKFWDRFFRGVGRGLKNWSDSGGEGGLGGLVGSVATGGIGSAASKGFDQELTRDSRNRKLLRGYSQASAMEDAEAGRAYKEAQTSSVLDKPKLAREQMQAKVKAQIVAQQNRLDVINRQADIRSGEAKVFVDEDGKMWKQFLKPDSAGKSREMEPIVNPTTGEQEFAPGEQMVDWEDPLTGQIIKAKAKQVLMPGATIAQGNAQRAQDADKTNASQEFEAQKTNATNITKYNVDLLAQAQKISESSGKSIENLAEVQGYANEIEGLKNQLANISTDFSQDFGGEKQKLYNDILTKIAKADNAYQQALGKSEAGRQAVELLKSQNIARPPMVQAVKFQAQRVGGGISGGKYAGKTYDLSKVRSYFPGKSDAEIRQIITAQGGSVQ